MAYTNSGLVVYTKLSPNHSGQRTHTIDRITPHCVVGQLSAESICGCFISTDRQASCNYGIGTDGRVSLCVEEKNRSWCSSSSANDQRAVTIECASDKTDPYAMNSAVYAALINLCADICRRNEKSKLLWLADKDKTLNYSPAADEMVLTVHRWFANKSCPGDWLYNRLSDLASKVTAKLSERGTTTSTQAKDFASLSEAQVIAKVGPLFTADQKKSGILASVSLAQFILESGYGKSELAQNANNCFGMKKSLSGNTWSGSAWDGVSIYTKKTQEYENGAYVTVTADFRKYACVEDSIADHSAYLLGAKNGSSLRYAGISGMTDYKAVAQLIKAGGYATSPTYVENLCSIIEKWNLTQYDAGSRTPADSTTDVSTGDASTDNSFPAVPFTVKVLISDLNYRDQPSMSGTVKGQTGKGVFTITKLSGSWGYLKSGAGWIYLGNPSYCTIGSAVSSTVADSSSRGTSSVPYTVRVRINDLNIREKPTVNAKSLGYTGKGVFTIVKEAAGEGSDKGWGLLKAYAGKENGWIALDYAEKC